MKRTALAIAITAALTAGACLQKDTTSTIYLRPDGSFTWVILEQDVRSDASDDASRQAEEADYVNGLTSGDAGLIDSLLALGAGDVRVRWLRSERPYAVMVDARFDSLARAFDAVLAPCGIPYESRIDEAGGVATWTLRAEVGLDGARAEQSAGEDCGGGDGLTGALDGLRIVLESGTFTAAAGFVLHGTDTATFDEAAIEASVQTTGVVELSLSWR